MQWLPHANSPTRTPPPDMGRPAAAAYIYLAIPACVLCLHMQDQHCTACPCRTSTARVRWHGFILAQSNPCP